MVYQFKFDMGLSINYVGKFHDAISCDARTSSFVYILNLSIHDLVNWHQ